LISTASDWFRTYLPGLFASGVTYNKFPTCEFVTLKETEPFPQFDKNNYKPKWLSILDMDFDVQAYFMEECPGIKFAWSLDRMRDKDYPSLHSILGAREIDFPEEELKMYGSHEYIHFMNRRFPELLARKALIDLLSGFIRHINNIRDSATYKSEIKQNLPHILKEIGQYISNSVDIKVAADELKAFTKRKSFDREVEVFKPCNPQFHKGYKEGEDVSLNSLLKNHIKESCIWIEKIEQTLRDLLVQYGSTLGAQGNIKLQHRIGCMTMWLIVLTVILIFLSLIMAIDVLGKPSTYEVLDHIGPNWLKMFF
jgi:hypothetical protein